MVFSAKIVDQGRHLANIPVTVIERKPLLLNAIASFRIASKL